MNSNNLWSVGSIHGDEYYTTEKVAEQIAQNIIQIPHLKVWLPFNDHVGGVWDKVLTSYGFDTVITDGQDFFETECPNGVQAIISNPPFSRKGEILKRTEELNLKFVYILPFTWLNDSIPLEYGCQVMLFRKRMHFSTPNGDLNKPRCNCFVLSNGLLKSNFITIWE